MQLGRRDFKSILSRYSLSYNSQELSIARLREIYRDIWRGSLRSFGRTARRKKRVRLNLFEACTRHEALLLHFLHKIRIAAKKDAPSAEVGDRFFCDDVDGTNGHEIGRRSVEHAGVVGEIGVLCGEGAQLLDEVEPFFLQTTVE